MVIGLQSFSWDSNINNGATTFDNVSNFVFNKDTLQNSVQFNSESLVTDFENSEVEFDNIQIFMMRKAIPITWDYNKINFKELSKDQMIVHQATCVGVLTYLMEIIQMIYTDPNPYTDRFLIELTTPTMYPR